MKQPRSSDSGATKKRTPPKSIDDYLAALPEDARAALENLRKTIKAAAPKATEVISYQIPAFKHHGLLVSFAAFKNHCSFYPMSPDVMRAHAADLKGYDISKGTIHFPADRPLPATLVRKLVKARIVENEKHANK
jgi:uncharacterized protein YdhG (YjbR/CyaY superfamily)